MENKFHISQLFKLNAAYTYKFQNGLSTTARLDYMSNRYADIQNNISLGNYFDLGFSFIYSFQPNLDLTLDINNILNQKNYYWNGYKEVPINIIIGVNYRL
ncbi:MAG: TonB-dependent receptor [Ignavibacteriales bacterium]|nr:TonB-dependent receptor [Ignavibacteriales bacterium]